MPFFGDAIVYGAVGDLDQAGPLLGIKGAGKRLHEPILRISER